MVEEGGKWACPGGGPQSCSELATFHIFDFQFLRASPSLTLLLEAGQI